MGVAMENRCVAVRPDAPESEPYRVLGTQVFRQTMDRQLNTVMVTSALPGEGKTLTAINLALTFARDFSRTALLVDCDLRKPSVYRYLGLSGEKGIIDSLLDGTPVNELIVWPGIEKFTVISGGRPVNESATDGISTDEGDPGRDEGALPGTVTSFLTFPLSWSGQMPLCSRPSLTPSSWWFRVGGRPRKA